MRVDPNDKELIAELNRNGEWCEYHQAWETAAECEAKDPFDLGPDYIQYEGPDEYRPDPEDCL
jgi:hypothetical protein